MNEQMDKFKADLGARIREKRVAAGMTQAELALAVGYDDDNGKSMISKIENGKVEPPISKLFTFAAALETDVVYLMGWDKPKRVDEKEAPIRARMTEEEGILLSIFRQLNAAGKQAAISMMTGIMLNKDFVSHSEQVTDSTLVS